MKKVIIPISILIFICLSLGIFGFILNINADEKEKAVKVSYRYFINGEESKNMPEEDDGYQFDKYKCTNNVTGRWSEAKWKFTPKQKKSASCRLYFVDREYEIELIAPDGVVISGDEKVKIKKDSDATFVIAPNEGLAIKEVTCTNDQTAKYEDGKVIVEKPNDDATCTVVTEDAKYSVEVTAISGKVTDAKQEAKFGQNVIFNVTPNSSYILDNVSCTNNQNATWSNGKLTISKITASTKCTVAFKSNEYSVTVNATNATVPTKTKTITANGTVSFSVTPVADAKLQKISCTNGQTGKWTPNSFTVTSVKSNTTCSITFVKPQTQTTE